MNAIAAKLDPTSWFDIDFSATSQGTTSLVIGARSRPSGEARPREVPNPLHGVPCRTKIRLLAADPICTTIRMPMRELTPSEDRALWVALREASTLVAKGRLKQTV